MEILGWALGLVVIAIGVWLYRYPSRYGRGFVQALSLVMILGGLYVIWVAHLLASHASITRALF